jgi:hypothetical protein
MLWRRGKSYSQDLRERVFAEADDGEAVGEIATAHLRAQHNLPVRGDPVDLKDVLRKVKADDGRLHDGRYPLMVAHKRQPLWHIAMPGAGAVHPISFEQIVR